MWLGDFNWAPSPFHSISLRPHFIAYFIAHFIAHFIVHSISFRFMPRPSVQNRSPHLVDIPLAVYIYYMYHVRMNFEFDPKKAIANYQKHGVSFAEVEPVFYDAFALTSEDRDASGEARFVTVGADALGRLVAVCWNQRGDYIRLISARFATSTERKSYEN